MVNKQYNTPVGTVMVLSLLSHSLFVHLQSGYRIGRRLFLLEVCTWPGVGDYIETSPEIGQWLAVPHAAPSGIQQMTRNEVGVLLPPDHPCGASSCTLIIRVFTSCLSISLRYLTDLVFLITRVSPRTCNQPCSPFASQSPVQPRLIITRVTPCLTFTRAAPCLPIDRLLSPVIPKRPCSSSSSLIIGVSTRCPVSP